ncbi:hypothetical protein PILCRDRAFT_1569 [Piloderma croceum F 1598]|uniref:Uncharacterized protein n=1 Tax=Piloderma croceum (strain F 1598) TaxID=765440 RepID=A0A0C3BUL9_PILCF|nr:hypothetical protein PILCRDRAFT_1569 [Piloderma croceum F 1598]
MAMTTMTTTGRVVMRRAMMGRVTADKGVGKPAPASTPTQRRRQHHHHHRHHHPTTTTTLPTPPPHHNGDGGGTTTNNTTTGDVSGGPHLNSFPPSLMCKSLPASAPH